MLGSGHPVYVSAISVVELVCLIDKGKIPAVVAERVGRVCAIRLPVFGSPSWTSMLPKAPRKIPREAVPDLPDRVIAATALPLGIPLVTRDGKIQASGIQTVW